MIQELPSELANILKPFFNTNNIEQLFKKQVRYYQDVLEAYINLVLDKQPHTKKFQLCNYNKFVQVNKTDRSETISNYLNNLKIKAIDKKTVVFPISKNIKK